MYLISMHCLFNDADREHSFVCYRVIEPNGLAIPGPVSGNFQNQLAFQFPSYDCRLACECLIRVASSLRLAASNFEPGR